MACRHFNADVKINAEKTNEMIRNSTFSYL